MALRDFAGSLSQWIDYLHAHYRAIVGDAGIHLWGRPVCGWGGEAADGRAEAFWHMITQHTPTGRQLDLARCAALAQVWELLELLAAEDPRACWWRETRHRRGHPRRHLLVAPVDFSLLVVLRETRSSFILLTAYPVETRRRRSLSDRAAAS